MNLERGDAVNTILVNRGPDGAGDGRFYRTASGECILNGGARQSQIYDQNGLRRPLNGRLRCTQNAMQCRRECVQRT